MHPSWFKILFPFVYNSFRSDSIGAYIHRRKNHEICSLTFRGSEPANFWRAFSKL